MATFEQAELARSQHLVELRQLGAWGITVDEIKVGSKKTFSVVMFFEKTPQKPIPKTLEANSGGSAFTVPLVVRIQPRFVPE